MKPAPVAQTNKRENPESLTPHASNPQYNKINENQLFLSYAARNSFFTPTKLREFLAQFEKILIRKERKEPYLYFLENGAATIPLVRDELKMDEKSTYRGVNWLVKNGFLEKLRPIKGAKKGGPKPILYGLPGIDEKTIAEAIIKVQRNYEPAYKVVTDIVQRTWDHIKDEEIQFSKIVNLSRRHCQGYQFIDIAELAAQELHRKGVKIWR